MSRLRKRYLDCSKMTLEEAESFGTELATLIRDIPFWFGDLARYAEARWPDTHHQVWPEWVSPGQLARNSGVCKAYPKEEDREHEATYSQYKDAAGQPNRQALLAEIVDKGQTTDESRAAQKEDIVPPDDRPRWLLAIDVNYYLHRFWHSGAGVEAATDLSSWIQRTVSRLKQKGLTDVAACFDDRDNHRKKLTADAGWDDKYKDRPPKDPELAQQLNLVRNLIEKSGIMAVSVEGMEADDVMASYAAQFEGKVTLLTQDKDMRQCLSGEKCNILLDVEWTQRDETSGDIIPEYKWLSSKLHSVGTGITPEQWTDYQCIMGDNVDGIRGVKGIGAKGAADLIRDFLTVEGVIEAAKRNDASIPPKKREALIAFEQKLSITRQLVTLKSDLTIPNSTRLT